MAKRIWELMDELCPEGVEYVEVEEVITKVENSSQNIQKAEISDSGAYPVYTQGANHKPDGYSDNSSKLITDVPAILFGDHTNSLKFIEEPFIIGADGVKAIKPNASKLVLASKYLYYVLKEKISLLPSNYARHFSLLRKLIIPIPPLLIQEKIVEILDHFTKLEAELEAELEARTRQYEYYRNELLHFDKNQFKYQPLSELTIQAEKIKWAHQQKEFEYIDLSAVDRSTKSIIETQLINSSNAPSRAQQIIKTNDILFATTRPMLKRITIVNRNFNEQICSTGFCVIRINTQIVIPKFVYYSLQTHAFWKHCEERQEGASYPSITDKNLKDFHIPIPPLDVQTRIVEVLDKFDALVNDMTIGIPAEIAARRKQYEYYRRELLNFKRLEKVALPA